MSRKQLKLGVPYYSNAMTTYSYNSSNNEASAVCRVRGRMSVALSREREQPQALRPPQRERTTSSSRYRGKWGVLVLFLRHCDDCFFWILDIHRTGSRESNHHLTFPRTATRIIIVVWNTAVP